MDIKANLHYMHIAPRKVRAVAGLIRGMDVSRAELELQNLPKKSSLPLLKLLRSAVQNMKHNFQLDPIDVYIKELRVDGGPMSKRFMPRAFGRAATIRRRTSHVSLVLSQKSGVLSGKVKTKKSMPVVTEGEVKETFEKKKTSGRESKDARPQSPSFAKRMFRRKAI